MDTWLWLVLGVFFLIILIGIILMAVLLFKKSGTSTSSGGGGTIGGSICKSRANQEGPSFLTNPKSKTSGCCGNNSIVVGATLNFEDENRWLCKGINPVISSIIPAYYEPNWNTATCCP